MVLKHLLLFGVGGGDTGSGTGSNGRRSSSRGRARARTSSWEGDRNNHHNHNHNNSATGNAFLSRASVVPHNQDDEDDDHWTHVEDYRRRRRHRRNGSSSSSSNNGGGGGSQLRMRRRSKSLERSGDHDGCKFATKFLHAHGSVQQPPPSDGLVRCIQRRDWGAARERMVRCSQDAQYRVVRKHTTTGPTTRTITTTTTTPLHLALMHRAPRDVVTSIADADPSALYIQDTEGWTPLHIQILYNHNTNTQTNVSGNASGSRNDIEHHNNNRTDQEALTLSLIRRGGYGAAGLHSRFVGAPLHLACRQGGCSPAVVRELVRAHPRQVATPNAAGSTPATLLWKTYLRNKNATSVRLSRSGTDEDNNGNNDNNVQGNQDLDATTIRPALSTDSDASSSSSSSAAATMLSFVSASNFKYDYEFVDQVYVMIEATMCADRLSQPWYENVAFHDVIRFQRDHANDADLVSVFLRLHLMQQAPASSSSASSNVPMIFKRMKDGMLPLHVAAAYPYTRKEKSLHYWFPDSVPTDPFRLLFGHYPDAAKIPTLYEQTTLSSTATTTTITSTTSNHLGCSFLNNNKQRRGQQQQKEEQHRRNRYTLHIALNEGRRRWLTGIEELASIFPNAISYRDPKTGLYPFQLAAMPAPSSSTCSNNTTPNRKEASSANGLSSGASSPSASPNRGAPVRRTSATPTPTTPTRNAGTNRTAVTPLATTTFCDEKDQIETIYRLLLACPQVIVHSSTFCT